MDGDPVGGEPSQANGAGRKGPAPRSLAEIFSDLCPAYMAMGMSWDEFWHRNTSCHYAYRKAFEQKRRNRNWEMWMQGAYIYDAMLKVSPVMRAVFGKTRVPEPGKYPEEPYVLDKAEAKEREEAKRKAKFLQMLARFERESAENLKNERAQANNGSTPDAQEGEGG